VSAPPQPITYSYISGGYQNYISISYSYIGGGYQNTVDSETGNGYSSVVGGEGNNVYSGWSVIVGGYQSDVHGDFCSILGGQNHIINVGSQYSAIITGTNCTISGEYSVILTGIYAGDQGRIGWVGYSSGTFNNNSDQQGGFTILSGLSSSAQSVILTAGNTPYHYSTPSNKTSGGVNNIINLVPFSALRVKGTILAVDTVTMDTGSWDIDFVIKQGGVVSSTAIVGNPKISLVAADAAFVALGVSVTADTTNGGPNIAVTNTAGWTNVTYIESNLSVTELVIPSIPA
jgi:hypothetical protein